MLCLFLFNAAASTIGSVGLLVALPLLPVIFLAMGAVLAGLTAAARKGMYGKVSSF